MKLALDTSSNKVAISIEDRGDIYCKYSEGDFSQAEEIALLLQELCQENNLLLKNIKEIYCVIGPGSFTAIRVLVAFVKGFILGSNIKIFPISKFYYMLSNVIDLVEQKHDFEIFIDCKKDKGELFYQKILSNYKASEDIKIISKKNIGLNLQKTYVISDFDLVKNNKGEEKFFYLRPNDLKIELIFNLPPTINYYKLKPLYVSVPYFG